ncbi:MAG: cyclic nucleotide-binding domain-containing protein [Chloroflexi bacterium]|nr:cyclic nucleotide-binding domain-containing protein [Chloroflexota bacterium]
MRSLHGDELPASPLFGGVNQADWAVLLASAGRLDLAAGEPVFIQGGPADSFYAVLAGTVEVRMSSPYAKERVLAHLGVGTVLGETSLFLGGQHTVSIYTTEPCTLMRFPTGAFMDLIEQKQTGAIRVLYNMGHALALRLRTSNEQLGETARIGASAMVRNDGGRQQRFLR